MSECVKCVECSAIVRPRQEALECDSCKKWQHRTCKTGITRQQYREAVRDSTEIPFQCSECKQNETPDEDESILIEHSFEIPVPILEDSIEDDPIGDIHVDNDEMQYHIIENGTTRGKRKLVDTNGFSYTMKVLRVVDHLLPEEIALQDFVVDFEAALWCAIKERFPRFAIQGCVFHWAQAVYRKIQEHGLQASYNSRDDVYKYLRQLMALPFLPPEHVVGMFRQLSEKANSPQLTAIVQYIERTWINSNVFKVDQWSVFMSSIRTNNDVEGWHNRLNSKLHTRGPVPFYLLVVELYAESESIPAQMKLVSEGKLSRHQRKKTRQVQGKIFSTWDRYCRHEISASQLLRLCASLYGPSTD